MKVKVILNRIMWLQPERDNPVLCQVFQYLTADNKLLWLCLNMTILVQHANYFLLSVDQFLCGIKTNQNIL